MSRLISACVVALIFSYGGSAYAREDDAPWLEDLNAFLEALLAVASPERLLLISGNGDVIEPDDDVVSIGSGGPYALAAARAMLRHAPNLTAKEIVEQALGIAADICIYSNDNLTILELEAVDTAD